VNTFKARLLASELLPSSSDELLAFGLLMGLAMWRLVVRDAMSRTGLCLYLILMLVASGFVAAAGYFGGEILLSGGCTMMTPLEIKGAMAAIVTSVVLLLVTFTADGIYWDHSGRETEPGKKPLAAEDLAAKGRSFFLRSCAQCHGRDADGGEEAPSLLKLQISGAHMTLVIQSGIKGEMSTFSKKLDYFLSCTLATSSSSTTGNRSAKENGSPSGEENRVCYAQWEAIGPFRTDHCQYVFGNECPRPNRRAEQESMSVRPFVTS
jgi:cytochrome c553